VRRKSSHRKTGRARGGGASQFVARVMLGLALMGFLVAYKNFIVFMNKLNPLQGLVIWYGLLAMALLIIFHGRTVAIAGVGSRSLGILEVMAILMVVWAFQIVLGVQSPWAAYASGKSPEQVPNVIYQSEDGVTYTLLYNLFWSLSPYFPNQLWKTYPEFIAFLTYVIAPIILVGLASLLLSAKKFKATVESAARF